MYAGSMMLDMWRVLAAMGMPVMVPNQLQYRSHADTIHPLCCWSLFCFRDGCLGLTIHTTCLLPKPVADPMLGLEKHPSV